jgi:putative FmdB family regulatory protein
MPLYDFNCPKCGTIELRHGFHDEHPKKCPKCNSKIELQLSVPFVHDAVPKTIGSLADKNPVGQYDTGETSSAQQKKKPYRPPWRKGPINKKLVNATEAQKIKYLNEGKI